MPPTSPKSPPRNLRDDVGHPNFDALIDFSVTAKAALKQFCEVHTTLCEEGLTEYPDALHQLVNGACYNLEQKLGGTPLITSKHFRRIEGSLADLAKKLQAATIQGNTAQQQADILMVWVAAQS
jgi:hypothetical protein